MVPEQVCTLNSSLKYPLKLTKGKKKKPFLPKYLDYLDALLLIRAFCFQISFVFIGALHTQEAVGRVANPTGQHSVPQHGIYHCAFTITGPGKSINVRRQIQYAAINRFSKINNVTAVNIYRRESVETSMSSCCCDLNYWCFFGSKQLFV